jgi:hypothetical protein
MLAIHVLMPWIGVKGVILTGAGIHIALGLSRLTHASWRQPATAAAVAVSVMAFALTTVFGGLDPKRVASGVYRYGDASLPADANVIYLRDGKTATITLTEHYGVVSIETNGKPDAGIRMGAGPPAPDESTMVLAGAIPLSLHPGAARVANIGFGSGLTSHTLLASPRLRQLDTVEIEPLIVEAARRGYRARNHNVFEDPRSHIIYEDAKTFFATSREPYDLIVSEPSNPWVSGVASLFSDEFYGRIVHYLRPDGYFVQWLQIYETNIDVVASVIKALSRHFGGYAIYNMNESDILIVATRAAAMPAPSEQFLAWPAMRAELDRIGVQSVADLRSRLIGDDGSIGPLFNGAPVPANSDFFPFVDLNAPRLRFTGSDAMHLTRLTSVSIPVLDILRADALPGPTPSPAAYSAVARDTLVRRALAVRRALVSGRLDELDPLSVINVLLLRASAPQCADASVQNAWKTAARNIGIMTTAYLRPADLADLWSTVRSTPCYREVSGPHKAWADLMAAVAARDAPEIATRAAQLLEASAAASRDERTYLTSVLATAYLRLGQMAQARALLAAQWERLDHGGELGLSLRELQALAQTGANPALAHSLPGPGDHGL